MCRSIRCIRRIAWGHMLATVRRARSSSTVLRMALRMRSQPASPMACRAARRGARHPYRWPYGWRCGRSGRRACAREPGCARCGAVGPAQGRCPVEPPERREPLARAARGHGRRCGIPYIYLRLDRSAQGGDGRARQCCAVVRRHSSTGTGSALTTSGRCSTPLPSTSRCGRSGARCSMADGWSSCRRGQPLAGGRSTRCFAREGRHGAEPDPSRVPAAHCRADARAGRRHRRCDTSSSAARRWIATLAPWFERIGDGARTGQHVRHHRDHRACHLSAARARPISTARRSVDRRADPDLRLYVLDGIASRCRSVCRASCISAARVWRAAI